MGNARGEPGTQTLCIEFGLKRSIDVMDLARIRQVLPDLVIHLEDDRALLHYPIREDAHHYRFERLVQIHSALYMIGLRPNIDYWIEGLSLTDPQKPTVELST